jgi:hypothetical protein
MSEMRLGDMIDDHCTKCRMLTNHSVVSIVDGAAAKVECRTCYSTHNYRHGKSASKKAPSKKSALFDEVLSKITGDLPS